MYRELVRARAPSPAAMTYTVVTDLMLPDGVLRLNEAQRRQTRTTLAGAVLREARRSAIELRQMEVDVTQGGAIVTLELQAPGLEQAETVVELLMATVLGNAEALSRWRIASCGVRLDRLRLEESFYPGPDDGPE